MLLMGILPSVIIMVIIFKNAVIKHKPMRKLASVFAISAISVVPAGILESIGSALMQAFIGGDPRRVYYPDMDSYLIYQLVFYVAVVGIVEEACKFFTFKWIVFHDRSFDNTYDGIIYGAASALGFATLENILYILQVSQASSQLAVALLRAVLSIPLHAVTGILMGYYFGVSKYRRYNNVRPNTRPERFAYIFSVLIHGVYDYLATAMSVDEDRSIWLIALICIMILIYAMIVRCIYCARKNSHNIYNKYYYEQLGGQMQDMMGGKTSENPTFFGVPLPMMYRRNPNVFNPYDPYSYTPPPQQYQQYQQYPQYQTPPQPQQPRYCVHCGKPISSASRFCPNCGKEVERRQPSQSQYQNTQNMQ